MSRPSPIIIPGADRWSARLHRWQGRGEHQQPAAPKPAAPDDEMQEPGLQGYACVYDRPFIKDGRILMFSHGCFAGSVVGGPAKSVLFDHNDHDVIGTTADGLEFASTAEGLAYRLPLQGNRRAAEVQRGIRSGTKGCASVGCVIHESEERESAGVRYTVIAKATLYEVSLVPQGAVSGTSASIVDLVDEPRLLFVAARSLSFKVDKLASNRTTDGRRLMDRLERLSALIS